MVALLIYRKLSWLLNTNWEMLLFKPIQCTEWSDDDEPMLT